MAISEYLRTLRAVAGNRLILMPAVTAIIFNDRGELLLQKSAETRDWVIIGGAMDPNEQPADCVRREVREECGIDVRVERIVGVHTRPTVRYSNGDEVCYVSITFVCRVIQGEARVNDDESLEVRYFPLDQIPPLREIDQMVLDQALKNEPAHFLAPGAVGVMEPQMNTDKHR